MRVMSEPHRDAVADQPAPVIDASREVRFAVVMYGGVSLAIYINGVARELFRMVQATAPERRKAVRSSIRADGSAAVYRKLAQLVEHGRLRADLCTMENGIVRLRDDASPILTRFVVDILSGTSAGGINAVYLAKALANDGDFEVLRDLWLTEADIGKLIHDAGSHEVSEETKREAFRTPGQPGSVLNSNRMFYKLWQALRGVGQPGGESSRLVEELDLFVTTTDVRGLVAPVVLDDVILDEKRHRNVFRFRYATRDAGGGRDHNDFAAANDAFLAFAARCTSAFPGAFEPMRLADVRAALVDGDAAEALEGSAAWRSFYRDYDASSFETRAFQDGGSLDNKPFSHAMAALHNRRADVPVDRKLIYIEPVPERMMEAEVQERPDMLANVKAALLELPRYETVREDLEGLQNRNRAIRRLAEILRDREEDVRLRRHRGEHEARSLRGVDWARRDLTAMIDEHGIAYGAYHRLRVATVLDDMAELVVRLAGMSGSAAQRGVRRLIEAWKDERYVTYLDGPDDERETENDFLYRLDLAWWLRRLAAAQEKAGELLAAPSGTLARSLRAHPRCDAFAELMQSWQPAERARFNNALRWVRHVMNDAFVHLRAEGRALRARGAGNPLRAHVEPLLAMEDEIVRLAALPVDHCAAAAGDLLRRSGNALDALASGVAAALSAAIGPAGDAARYALRLTRSAPASDGILDRDDLAAAAALHALAPDDAGIIALDALAFYYQQFEQYDLISFPVMHEAGAGERDVVDVMRVSPLDAGRIVPDVARRALKLKGTWFSNFGAFFRPDWRRNDMVWGRLDAAERIVCSVLPDGALDVREQEIRDALVDELHDIILAEEGFTREDLLAAIGSRAAFEPDGVVDVTARSARVLGNVVAGVRRARGARGMAAAWPAWLGGGAAFLARATVLRTRERLLSIALVAACFGVGMVLLALGTYGVITGGGSLRPWPLAFSSVLLAMSLAGGALLRGARRAVHGRPAALKRALIVAAASGFIGVAAAVAVLILVHP